MSWYRAVGECANWGSPPVLQASPHGDSIVVRSGCFMNELGGNVGPKKNRIVWLCFDVLFGVAGPNNPALVSLEHSRPTARAWPL